MALTLFMLFIMLIAGGFAMDLMRQEMKRAHIQNTLDTAVLAGAGAPYGVGPTPKEIVQDYMAKAGMASYLGPIDDDGEGLDDVIHTLNMSKVSATAKMSMDTHLLHLSGIKQLGAAAASTAERRVPKLEVSLVLDVSGSMDDTSSTPDADGNSVTKMKHLKKAAKEFVTSILNSTKEGDATISIVPFSWDSAPGKHIFEALNVDVRHDYSSCLEFADTDFGRAYIDPDVQQKQTIYTTIGNYGLTQFKNDYRTCFTNDYAEILPYSMSEADLHAKIDSLVAKGNTSADIGMKWGTALLDPKFQSVKTALNKVVKETKTVIVDGVATTIDIKMVDDRVGVVPAEYGEGETLKVVVLMGDGQNTYSNQFTTPSSYRGDDSDLFFLEWDTMLFQYAYDRYRTWKRSTDPAYCNYSNWKCVYTESSGNSYFLYDSYPGEFINLWRGSNLSVEDFNRLSSMEDGFKKKIRYTWEEAWGLITPEYYARKTGNWTPYNQFTNDDNRVSGSEKDVRMSSICTAAKNKGISVYTIGFEIKKNGNAETQLKNCASDPLNYFPAKGVNISDAFSAIASNVVNLRLTQ
ncbi:hypothetical protein DC366_08350 [Pelagivirga sediminicola]|uniref:Putative Flp pilus-assembly TadG-like N-terminal domain-containing protein n=1 Tax=Pelagivirga sediminicola TaxID=2170575 RepID=A0A2T7G7S7_9RHOB|nr:hypothetical protein DC366_08350 [Pelagivirga sediminicola]